MDGEAEWFVNDCEDCGNERSDGGGDDEDDVFEEIDDAWLGNDRLIDDSRDGSDIFFWVGVNALSVVVSNFGRVNLRLDCT